MKEVCEVCGGGDSARYEELLVTCSRCKSTRTHVYCMRLFKLEIPDAWFCESCQLGNDRTLAEPSRKEESLSSSTDGGHSRKLSRPRKVSHPAWKHHSKKQKPVETGKVKYISQDEVARLSSGAKAGSPLKTVMASKSRKTTPKMPKAPNRIFLPDRVEEANPYTPPTLVKHLRDGGFRKSSTMNQKALRTSKEAKERQSLTSEKQHAPKKRLLDDLIYAKNVETKMDDMISIEDVEIPCTKIDDLISEKKVETKMDDMISTEDVEIPCTKIDDLISEKKVETPRPKTDDLISAKGVETPRTKTCDLISAKDVETPQNKMDYYTKESSSTPSSSRPTDLEEKAPPLPTKEHVVGKRLVDASILSRKVENLNKKTKKEHVFKRQLVDASILRREVETLNKEMEEERVAKKQPVDKSILPREVETLNMKMKKEHVAKKQPVDASILSREDETLIKRTEKEHVTEKKQLDALAISREVETSNENSKTEKEPAKTLCELVSPRNSTHGIKADYVAEHNRSNVPEEVLPIIPPNFDLYLMYLPALHTTWNGGFSIVDNTSTCEVLEGFQAQPPCKVHKKAYEFSTKMPPILQLKMVPRLDIWADLFQDGCPDLQDIALYFFPADNNLERYREKYGQLFERLEIQSSIMIGYVNDVELIIFTSKQLNVDSQNVLLLKAEYFFCGVFLKPSGLLPELPSRTLACSYPIDTNMDDNASDDDMEIDMIGGKSVGRVDIVVLKNSFTCVSNERNTIEDSSALLKQATIVSKESDRSGQRLLVKFKLEPIRGHDKSPDFKKKIKRDNALENASLIGPLKHSQERSHRHDTTDRIADSPPGFVEKKRGVYLAIKAENNHRNPLERDKKRLKIEPYWKNES